MSAYLKPQTPLRSKKNDAYIYPLTTSDQVILPDGSRLNQEGLEGMITPEGIGALSMELLWDNASPVSEFAGGTEIVFESGYKKCRLELGAHYGRIGASIDFKPGEGLVASLMWADDGIYVSRSFETTANSLKANDGYQSKTVNNLVMIPIRIYGFKGVSE